MRRDELDDRERRLLRQLELQLRTEDPGLARKLGAGAPAIGARFSPTRWPWLLHLALGLLLLGTGGYLGVTSATVLGLVFVVAAAVRWLVIDGDAELSPEAARQWGPGARPLGPTRPPRRS